jgi:hypothetical protein
MAAITLQSPTGSPCFGSSQHLGEVDDHYAVDEGGPMSAPGASALSPGAWLHLLERQSRQQRMCDEGMAWQNLEDLHRTTYSALLVQQLDGMTILIGEESVAMRKKKRIVNPSIVSRPHRRKDAMYNSSSRPAQASGSKTLEIKVDDAASGNGRIKNKSASKKRRDLLSALEKSEREQLKTNQAREWNDIEVAWTLGPRRLFRPVAPAIVIGRGRRPRTGRPTSGGVDETAMLI